MSGAASAARSVRSATAVGCTETSPSCPASAPCPAQTTSPAAVSSSSIAGAVVGDAGGQDVGLERRRRHDRPGQLLDDARDAVHPAQGARRRAASRPPDGLHALPARQEDAERLRVDRLHLGPQRGERPAAQRPQHVGVAELVAGAAEHVRTQPTLHEHAAALEPAQGLGHDRDAPAVARGGLGGGERPVRPGVPAQEVAHGIGHDLGEHLGHADGQRDAERVPQPSGVLDRRPLLGALGRHPAEPDADQAARALELDQPARDLVAHLGLRALRRPPTR